MGFIFSKYQVYIPKVFLYNYNGNDFRLVRQKYCREKGFEENVKGDNLFIDVNSEEVQRTSLSRTKKNIREIALCNNFEYFCTFTVNSNKCDRYSLTDCQNNLKKILHKIKRINKDLAYIIITEKHKDNAYHFHGLIKGLNDFLYINDNGYFSCKYFDELGFNSFSLIKDYSKCCNYITKYITKDCVKNEHNQIYISSRGLKKATREELPLINFKPSFSNDFCDILDFSLDKLSYDEKIDFFYKLQKEKQ